MKIYISILLILYSLVGFTQKMNRSERKSLRKARVEVKFFDYVDAFDRVKNLYNNYPKNEEVNYIMAICLLHQKDNEKYALRHLSQIKNTKLDPNFHYYLGTAQHWNSKFEEAIASLQVALISDKRTISDSEVKEALSRAYKCQELINTSRKVIIQNLGNVINSEYQESVPVITPDHTGLFFTARKSNNVSTEKDHLDNYFQDIYYASLKNGIPSKVKNLEKINSKYHDASSSISSDGKTFVFFKTNKENVNTGDLYIATIGINGDLSDIKKLPEEINSSFIESSACLSPDGNTIYISSNRPYGYGGFDLYQSKKLPNGQWGEVTNLGPTINTEKNEDAPFLHSDGKTLYFSSNGHIGMGGFDIYSCELQNNKLWSTSINIGAPINTIDHDMYFTISPDSREGYFSSNRAGGYGNDDLYKVTLLDHESFDQVITGKILSEKDKKPVLSEITVIGEESKALNGIYRTNINTGKFVMVVKPLETYQIIVKSEGYKVQFLNLTSEELLEHDLEIILKRDEK